MKQIIVGILLVLGDVNPYNVPEIN